MSRALSAPAAAPGIGGALRSWRLLRVLSAWRAAYMSWRAERLTLARLQAMSDRDLKDIGIVRSQIEFVAKVDVERDRLGVL